MDLQDAHALFKRYRGWLYMMAREENEKYHDFLALNIPKTTLESWRQELLEEYFGKAKNDPQRAIFEASKKKTANGLCLFLKSSCRIPTATRPF